MREIPISLLHAFVVFGDSPSILVAAKRIGITQPALSKQLQALEAHMPGKVFLWKGRRKELTAFGLALHGRLKQRIGNIQELVAQTWAMHSAPENASLRIGARRGVLDRIAGRVAFRGALTFVEAANEEIYQGLLRRELDLGLLHRLPETSELIAKPLFREEFQLVVPRKLIPQKIAFGEKLSARLRELPALGYKPDDEILSAICGAKARVARATENYASLAGMAQEGMGWAALPSYFPAPGGCWAVPLPAKVLPARQFYLAYGADLGSVPWFRELLAEIKGCFPAARNF